MKQYLAIFIVFAGFFFASQAHASTAALVQSATGITGATTDGATSTFSNATVAGNTIIVVFTNSASGITYPPSVPTDSQGNTYTQMAASPLLDYSTSTYFSEFVWTATSSVSATDTITLHDPFAAIVKAYNILEVSGINGGTLDGMATSSCSVDACNSGSITMTASSDFVLGIFARYTSMTFTPGAPFTTAATSTNGAIEYNVMSASSVNPSATVSANTYVVGTMTLAFPTTITNITFDATSSTPTAGTQCQPTCSWSHTVGTGSDGILTMDAGFGGYAAGYPNFTNVIASATYDGEPMTLGVQSLGPQYGDAEIWYLLNPPSGTHTISVTGANPSSNYYYQLGAASFFGVDQTNPIDATANNSSTLGTATVSITPAHDNDWLVDAFNLGNANYAITPGASQSVIFKSPQYKEGDGASYIPNVSPASTQTFTWTGNPSGDAMVDVAVSLKPAGSSPPPPVTMVARVMTAIMKMVLNGVHMVIR